MISGTKDNLPSPSSSALSTIKEYFSNEMVVMIQKINEKSSYTASSDMISFAGIVPKNIREQYLFDHKLLQGFEMRKGVCASMSPSVHHQIRNSDHTIKK